MNSNLRERSLLRSTLLFEFALCILTPSAYSWTIEKGALTEDFTDVSHWDVKNSTGLWNMVDHAAQAGRVAGGVTTQSLNFGDGSEGVLNTDSGYVFDTDAHPNGFNFVSVNISGGTIRVKGSSSLIIRSLSTMNITPTLMARDGTNSDGINGVAINGPSGGVSSAGRCSGGKGGDAIGSSPAGDGSLGVQYDGTVDSSGAGGQGHGAATSTAGTLNAGYTGSTLPGLTSLWDTSPATSFICGSGGPGGGGHNTGATYAPGGSGGAGGGTIHLTAVGDIHYSSIDVGGGTAGAGTLDAVYSSGAGLPGNGGAVWIQTLHHSSGTIHLSSPSVISNAGGTTQTALDGAARIDNINSPSSTESGGGAPSSPGNGLTTGNVAASQSYTLVSQPYDLGTQNAAFFSQPNVDTTLNGGTVSITYLGSQDGAQFSSADSDITHFTDQHYRYIKFVITITTASTAALSPQLNSVSVPFSELNIRLSGGGCGTIEKTKKNQNHTLGELTLILIWLEVFWIMKNFLKKSLKQYPENPLLGRSQSTHT